MAMQESNAPRKADTGSGPVSVPPSAIGSSSIHVCPWLRTRTTYPLPAETAWISLFSNSAWVLGVGGWGLVFLISDSGLRTPDSELSLDSRPWPLDSRRFFSPRVNCDAATP